MFSIKNIPNPIVWHDGMPVTQHHFQQEALRNERLVQFHANMLSPCYWGVRSLTIDKNQILQGIFEITEVEGIFPDGMAFYYETGENESLTLDLAPSLKQIKKEGVVVYLTSAARSLSSTGLHGDIPRYETYTKTLYEDQLTQDNPVEIIKSKPILRLLITKSLSPKYTGFPIARISYKDANYYLEEYQAPCLSVEPGSKIGGLYNEIISKLRHKATFLSEKLQSVTPAFGMGTTLEIRDMLRSITLTLPSLEVLANVQGIHPLQLYLSLAHTTGALAALEPGMLPPTPKPYNHNDLLALFQETGEYIHKVLEQGVNETYLQVAFQLDSETGFFKLNLSEELYSEELILGVGALGDSSRESVVDWFAGASVGSLPFVDNMKSRRITGPQRTPFEGNEDLVPLRGMNLFKLEADPEYIVKGEELNIFNLSLPEGSDGFPNEIILFVKNE